MSVVRSNPSTPAPLYLTPMTLDELGEIIEALTAGVALEREKGIVNGPTEQWRDALAEAYLRQLHRKRTFTP